MKILLIDHDPRIRKLLVRNLKDEFVIDTATCAKVAEELIYSNHYDLIITDIILPDIDGEEFITILKSNLEDIPVIVLSARSHVSDKHSAFNRGADDYLVKPVNTIELKARMKALLRRKSSYKKLYTENLKEGFILIDRSKKMAFQNGQRLILSKKEMQLLEFLLMNKGRVLTKGEILENVWSADASPLTNTVEVHVKRLRDKIEKVSKENYIETIHGIGYLFEFRGVK